LGHAPVQLGVDQRRDVHAVHDDVLQLAVDLDVAQLGAAHADTGEVDRAHAGVVEGHLNEGGAPHAHPLHAHIGEVLLAELCHGTNARTGSGRSTSGFVC